MRRPVVKIVSTLIACMMMGSSLAILRLPATSAADVDDEASAASESYNTRPSKRSVYTMRTDASISIADNWRHSDSIDTTSVSPATYYYDDSGESWSDVDLGAVVSDSNENASSNKAAWYRKRLYIPESMKTSKHVMLTIDYKSSESKNIVYINGNGSFKESENAETSKTRSNEGSRAVDITDYVRYGDLNIIALKSDALETLTNVSIAFSDDNADQDSAISGVDSDSEDSNEVAVSAYDYPDAVVLSEEDAESASSLQSALPAVSKVYYSDDSQATGIKVDWKNLDEIVRDLNENPKQSIDVVVHGTFTDPKTNDSIDVSTHVIIPATSTDDDIDGKNEESDLSHKNDSNSMLGSTARASSTLGTSTESTSPTTGSDDKARDNDESDDLSKNEVSSELPASATLDLFDYWLTSENDYNGEHYSPDYWEKGISAGHEFKFQSDTGNSAAIINRWTGSATPRQGIVYPTLQNDWPMVASNANGGVEGVTKDDNLKYLFDANDVDSGLGGSYDYKRAHTNVQGLLRQDDKGYWGFDSNQYFAHYDKTGNRVRLYNTPYHGSGFGSSGYGQFFPFDDMKDMFQYDEVKGKFNRHDNGNLWQKDVTTLDRGPFNHYMGVSLKVPFTIEKDGMLNGEDQKFEFNGDDDVWVFVDGILIADLGGIHNMSSVSIDFKTGKISGIEGIENTSIREQVEKALVSKNNTVSADYMGKNFTDGSDSYAYGSEHTLQMFYLERGNNVSDMKLKFNITPTAATKITKMDSANHNEKLSGAKFEVYRDDDVEKDANGHVIAVKANADAYKASSTDSSGTTVFTFDEDGTYWIREAEAPAGYVKDNSFIGVTVENNKIKIMRPDGDRLVYDVIGDTTGSVDLSLQNTKFTSSMPITGSREILAIVCVLIMLAVSIVVRFTRSKKNTNNYEILTEN